MGGSILKITDNIEYQKKYRELHSQGLTNKDMIPLLPMSYSSISVIGHKLGLRPNGGTGWGGFRSLHPPFSQKKVMRSDGVLFNSGKQAAEATGVRPDGISKCCRYKRSLCGGYGWRFYSEVVQ